MSEVRTILIEQTALKRLEEGTSAGLDFFRVAHVALRGDRLIRIIRILEKNKRVASFWYLHRCEKHKIESLLSSSGISIEDLDTLSKRLKDIRRLKCIEYGDIPAIGLLMVDGEVISLRARNTTLSERQVSVDGKEASYSRPEDILLPPR